MWESNPPKELFTPITGFEDQGAHQHPSTPVCNAILSHVSDLCNRFFLKINFFYSSSLGAIAGKAGPGRRMSPSFLRILFLS